MMVGRTFSPATGVAQPASAVSSQVVGMWGAAETVSPMGRRTPNMADAHSARRRTQSRGRPTAVLMLTSLRSRAALKRDYRSSNTAYVHRRAAGRRQFFRREDRPLSIVSGAEAAGSELMRNRPS